MTLEEVITVMREGGSREDDGQASYGDPSIYGAIREQMDLLGRMPKSF
jgi:precorrin-4 methylase